MLSGIRRSVQYLGTVILGLTLSHIFTILMRGYYERPQADGVMELLPFAGGWQIAFLVVLGLNILRVGHSLVVLETSDEFHAAVEGREFSAYFQIMAIIAFALLSIVTLQALPALGTDAGRPGFIGVCAVGLFAVLALWDIPTVVPYFYRWFAETERPAREGETDAEHLTILAGIRYETGIVFGKFRQDLKNNLILRVMVRWSFYDLVLIVVAGIGLGGLGEGVRLQMATVVLGVLFLVDYWPFEGPVKIPRLGSVGNGELYFSP